MHSLPELPYPLNSLTPHISAETLEYHWGKHHRAYVDSLNRLITGTTLADMSLEQLVQSSSGPVFNSAGQHFNHSLYWNSLSAKGGREPRGALAEAIGRSFGSFANLRAAFTEPATTHFGSGWAWLVVKPDKTVRVEVTHDAGCPLTSGDIPLLTCDLWEHAYYIDYRNQRARYLEAFWRVANWDFAEKLFEDTPLGSAQAAARVVPAR
jgi:Fe-Mn family superoxide dismutase